MVDTSGAGTAACPRDGGLLAIEDASSGADARAEPFAHDLARAHGMLAPEPVAPLALGGVVRCVP